MDSPNDKSLLSAIEHPSGAQSLDPAGLPETLEPIRTDRLYQIAALAAGLILLATAL